jgi:hypothetical protein
VVLDGTRAEEELSSDLLVAPTLTDEVCDLEFLGRELGERARIALPRGLARGTQLATCTLRPGFGAESIECLDSGS